MGADVTEEGPAEHNTGQQSAAEHKRAEQSRAQMSAKKVTCSLFGITLSRTKVSRAQGSQKCLFNVRAVRCCLMQCRLYTVEQEMKGLREAIAREK